MNLCRVLRLSLRLLLAVVLILGLVVGSGWLYLHPAIERTTGIVYGHRHGHELTFEVVRPAKPNGLGVVFMVSGGWKSGTNAFHPWMAAPLLRRGYTVFPVCHVSQPEATVMEIFDDVSHALRFIRFHAPDYGVDPQRLGVSGGSAGGHLSLMLATRGGPGPADAPDPVDRVSSAVQAVAIFYPVTDLLNLGDSTENLHDDGPPKSFLKAFGQEPKNLAVWKVTGHDMSPIYYLGSNLPPTLIYHGDADTLVPLDQSQRFQKRAQELGRTVELVVHPGGHHGWPTMLWDVRKFADWFDRCLQPAEAH
jgi:acetyl esterase/lipase